MVERIEVASAKINADANFIGGIVAHNVSALSGEGQSIARINRSSANLVIGYDDETAVGTNAVVGGVVAQNKAGIIVFVYSTGNVALKDSATFGGIVGINEFTQVSSDVYGGNIKDSYSVMVINNELISSDAVVGGVIGKNSDMQVADGVTSNKIIGCYYSAKNANGYDGVGKEYLTQTNGSFAEISKEDSKYYVQGYSHDGLRNESVLYSREIGDETRMWDFDNVWQIVAGKNNGFPVIDYSKVPVDDDFSFNVVVEEEVVNVTFNYNGATSGNTIASKEVVIGETYGILPTPSKTQKQTNVQTNS